MLIGRSVWVYYQEISNCCRPVLTYWLTDLCYQWQTDWWSCTAFCCNVFSFLQQLCTVDNGIFIWLVWTSFLLVNYIINMLPDKYFKIVFWMAKSYTAVWSVTSWALWFLNVDSSQGSAATYLRCGGMIKHDFVANLTLSLSAKEFWKSVNIWGSCGQEFSVLFFDSRCIYVQYSPNVCMLPMDVSWSSFGNVAIRVLWITSCLHIMGRTPICYSTLKYIKGSISYR